MVPCNCPHLQRMSNAIARFLVPGTILVAASLPRQRPERFGPVAPAVDQRNQPLAAALRANATSAREMTSTTSGMTMAARPITANVSLSRNR